MTSIEKFHWLDQNPELPNYIFGTLRFEIRIDPEIARQAVAIVLQRQPLAAMEPKLIGGRWCWQPIPAVQFDSDRFFSSICLGEDDDTGAFHALGPLKVRRDYVSYFVSVTEFSKASPSEVVSEVSFQSHHAASDGVACVGLINDWLTVYNNLVAGEPAETGLAKLNNSSFENRGVLGLLSWNYLKGFPQQTIALFGAAKFIFRKTEAIAGPSASIENPPPFPAIRGSWVDAAILNSNRRRATDNQVGFTAWCLTKCFIALDGWNQKRWSESKTVRPAQAGGKSAGQTKSNSVWRILLPISTRSSADRAAVAANRTAVVQIDRQPPATEAELIPSCQSIDYEINFIRRWQLEKMFLLAIRLASLSNAGLAKTANNPVSRGAAVFTHLGRPFKRAMIHLNRLPKSAANLPLARPIDFDLAGPIRHGTPINLSFARFDHRLKISLHYDAQVISTAEADRLLATIVELFSAEVA